MKIKFLFLSLAFCAAANAATVTVTAGFGTQGLNVTNSGVAATSFAVTVGNLSGGVFTQFSTTIIDTGKVNGVFTAQAPSSLNGLAIHLLVADSTFAFGAGQTLPATGSYVILTTSPTATNFPADVAAAGGPSFNAALGSGLAQIASSNATFTPGTSTINLVPEPSSALLGALGALGLLRRRRI